MALTDLENNKVFFNGKSIFAINDTYGGKFRNLDNIGHCVIRHNYEIIDFHKRCFDDQGNLDDLVDVVAGRTHFVVLTSECFSCACTHTHIQKNKNKLGLVVVVVGSL